MSARRMRLRRLRATQGPAFRRQGEREVRCALCADQVTLERVSVWTLLDQQAPEALALLDAASLDAARKGRLRAWCHENGRSTVCPAVYGPGARLHQPGVEGATSGDLRPHGFRPKTS